MNDPKKPKIIKQTQYGITEYTIEYTDSFGDRVLSSKTVETKKQAIKMLSCNRYDDGDGLKNPAAVALGKLGGSAKSDKKSASSRANGAKGGRPKKIHYVSYSELIINRKGVRMESHAKENKVFIDLFSGCGGLSLGLMNAGWHGLFAIEHNSDAFKTLRHNLIDANTLNISKNKFEWPEWLPKTPHEIKEFVQNYHSELKKLSGKVHLVAGGPPCQGFSFAGKRSGNDPRNELFKYHLQIVDIIRPNYVLLENVHGIEIAFNTRKKERTTNTTQKSYAKRIYDLLEKHGYIVQQQIIRACDFGVPQLRPRYFTLGIRKDITNNKDMQKFKDILFENRNIFLRKYGLPTDRPVTVSEAISDLTTEGKELIECIDTESRPGFFEVLYNKPISTYQGLMHENLNGHQINSLRLVKHHSSTINRFKKILATCRKGVQLSDSDRKLLGIKKNALVPLSPDKPSHTLTTLPDDLLHYSEPRIHTVREHARLQSFPDWFEFHGKFTTGGNRRKNECPRYSQVGNAVPPLLAQAIGEVLLKIFDDLFEKKTIDRLHYTDSRTL